MHDSDKFKYGAFGLVLGLGLSLLFFVWTVPEFSDPNYYIDRSKGYSESASNTQANKPENEPQWRYWAARLVSAEDTLAQWVMAFFTVVIAGLTGVALCYIKKTADFASDTLTQAEKTTEAAKATVDETRRIGEAQTRAYLSCVGASCWVRGRHLIVEFKVKNFGQSPAINVTSTLNFEYSAFDDPKFPEKVETKKSLNVVSGEYLIPSGVEVPIRYLFTKDAISSSNPNSIKEIADEHRLHFFSAHLSWLDVFEKKDTLDFNVFNDSDLINLRIKHKPHASSSK